MGLITFSAGTRVAIDTNVLVYTVERIQPYMSALSPLWESAERGDVHVVVSALALTEVLVRPLQMGDAQMETAYRRLLLDSEALQLEPIDTRVLELAASLRASYSSLKTPDAIHLATAMSCGCGCFLTNDRQLRHVSGLEVLVLDELIGGK